jgi:hypothetical protein
MHMPTAVLPSVAEAVLEISSAKSAPKAMPDTRKNDL